VCKRERASERAREKRERESEREREEKGENESLAGGKSVVLCCAECMSHSFVFKYLNRKASAL
jgi:hypothetical protein